MKHYSLFGTTLIIALLALAGIIFLRPSDHATAQCSPAPTGGADSIDCTGPINNPLDTAGGNDTVNLDGVDNTIFESGGGNDSITNTDDIENSGFAAEGGNDTFNNSGDIEDSCIDMGAGNDVMTNSGEIDDSCLYLGSGNDSLDNTGDIDDLCFDAEGGNDTFTNSGEIDDSCINFSGGNDSFQNSGDIEDTDIRAGNGDDIIVNSGDADCISIEGNSGNDLIINSGYFECSEIQGGDDEDLIFNFGTFDYSELRGGDDEDFISNTGDFLSSLLSGGDDDDYIYNEGDFMFGSWLRGGLDDDLVVINTQSTFDNSSLIDGDRVDQVSGNNDTLVFYFERGRASSLEALQAAVAALDLTVCHAHPDPTSAIAAGCFVDYNGGTYVIINFEQVYVMALAILQSQGIDAGPQLPIPQELCATNEIKVIRLPNGDVEYYAGFAQVNVPNGFLVGKVTLPELAAGVRRFQDRGPLNPGWYVVIKADGDSMRGQVYDALGRPVGAECKY
jgi:hypothetical protein